MKFDVEQVRYLTKEDYRILTAVEMGMKNHQKVPLQLVQSISGLNTSINQGIYQLCRKRLIKLHHQGVISYSLTTLGYDYLALNALVKSGAVEVIGSKMGVGKEADVYAAITPSGEHVVVKFHRLGRTSFTSVKNNRNYLQGKHTNWLYLSRLSAQREFAYLKLLTDRNFPVPKAIEFNRNCVVMNRAKGTLLQNISHAANPDLIAARCFALIIRLAQLGLIHGDFNEFNLFVDQEEKVEVIDFPQVIPIDHINAKSYFERDVNCIRRFMEARFGYVCQDWPKFEDVKIQENNEKIFENLENFEENEKIMEIEKSMLESLSIENNMKRGEVEFDFTIDVDPSKTSQNSEEKVEKKSKKHKESTVLAKHKISKNGELTEKQLKMIREKVRKQKK